MAVYKVIQDVEAEDKIVGPLSLKAFIYAMITMALLYISFRLVLASSLGPVRWLIILLFLLPALLFGILAAPLGRDQPTEVWLLSRIQFFLQARKRVWNQAGISDLVTITVPKRINRLLTNNLTQREVRSRLKALATTLDTRGWAVKNVAFDPATHPDYLDEDDTDRLVGKSEMSTPAPITDVHAADDILDVQNNVTAQHFEALIQKADSERKKDTEQRVEEARQDKPAPQEDADFEFLDRLPPTVDESGNTVFVGRKVIAPKDASTVLDDNIQAQSNNDVDESAKKFLEEKHKRAEAIHAAAPKSVSPPRPQNKAAVTEVKQTAKLKELSEVGKDDKLSTLAQMAKRETSLIKQIGPGEVEIDLH